MKKQQGLSLLETLVALMLLSIALTAAFRAIGIASGQTGEIHDRLLAEWIAQDRFAEHRAMNHWLPTGVSEGEVEQANTLFRFREEVNSTPNALFRRIDVFVYRADTGDRVAAMTGYLSHAAQ